MERAAVSRLEVVCPAGTPAALEAAVAAGADSVYFGFRDGTNARNFPGLNFSREEAEEAIAHCHRHGVRAMVAVNSYPQAGRAELWQRAVADAHALGADAVILADLGLARWARSRFPHLRLHLSVQASAANPEAIAYWTERAGIRRVVLPRLFSMEDIRTLVPALPVESEVFVFGGLCVMAEGRCMLSSYVTGRSPNLDGVCSPAEWVRYGREGPMLTVRLGDVLIDRIPPGDKAGYPTLCKGCYRVRGRAMRPFEEPASLDLLSRLPELMAVGVRAIKIEGRQRGRAYVERVVRAVRGAAEQAARGRPLDAPDLRTLMEGGRATEGALARGWR